MLAQVKRCDEMARKLRFFHDQVCLLTLPNMMCPGFKCWLQFNDTLPACLQVQKSELIVGARMGGDNWELDELEVELRYLSNLFSSIAFTALLHMHANLFQKCWHSLLLPTHTHILLGWDVHRHPGRECVS